MNVAKVQTEPTFDITGLTEDEYNVVRWALDTYGDTAGGNWSKIAMNLWAVLPLPNSNSF